MIASTRWLVVLSAVLAGAGCATTNVVNPSPLSQATVVPAEDKYFLLAGDTISVKAYTGTTLDHEETLVVRPDGRVRLAILEKELIVGGLEPLKVSQLIEQEYKAFYTNPPRVVVNVATFAPRQVYVGGEVTLPHNIPYTGKSMNVLSAIISAGYMTDRAEPENIIVIRPQGLDTRPLAFALQLNKAITNEDPMQNIALLPEDIVVVTMSKIGEVDKWVDLYIRRMLPTETMVAPAIFLR